MGKSLTKSLTRQVRSQVVLSKQNVRAASPEDKLYGIQVFSGAPNNNFSKTMIQLFHDLHVSLE